MPTKPAIHMINGRCVSAAVIIPILFCIAASCTTAPEKRANSVLTPPAEASANYNRQIELNGLLLYQFKKAVDFSLNPPFQTVEKESSKFELHKIDREAYMVFEYSKKMPHNIQSIQLTGRTNNMTPFNGLILGDNKEKVITALGGSFSVTQIDQPRVQKYDYQNANYSIEIDAEDKLFSIRIHADRGLLYPITSTELPWNDFKRSVLKKDLKEILSCFRPDIEIYKENKTLFIKKRFKDFLENPDPGIYEVLLGEENSVYSEIQQTEPEGELRLVVGLGGGWVYKFYNSKILNMRLHFETTPNPKRNGSPAWQQSAGWHCRYFFVFRGKSLRSEGNFREIYPKSRIKIRPQSTYPGGIRL